MIKIYNILLNNKQLITYGIIGCFCVGVDFLIYSILVQIIGLHYSYSHIISVHCGIFVSFFLNRHFTFKVKNRLFLRFISFYVVGFTGLAISFVLLIFLVEKIELNRLVSKGFTIIAVAFIQFILNKYISFRNER
jgi:putative flippase GtrA